MKRCPECRRDYTDETLNFCLDDGAALLEGPVSFEPPTSVLPIEKSEAPTRHQVTTTGATALLAPETARNLGKGKRRGLGILGAVFALCLIGLAVIGYGGYKFYLSLQTPTARPIPTSIRTQRLTGDGKVRAAEISPDGKFLAYLRTEGGEGSLWLKQIQTNSTIAIVKPGEFERFSNTTFSPDGNFIYFNAVTKTGGPPTVYRVPTLGGTATKVLTNANAIEISPDGKQVSFGRLDLAANETSVYVANIDGSGERKLASRSGAQFFDGGAVWSPDGRTVAVTTGDDTLVPTPAWISIISVADGSISTAGSLRFSAIDDHVWHPSGDSFILSATDTPIAVNQLWELTYPDGSARRLTNNLNGHYSVSITGDGKSIVTGEIAARTAVWVSPDSKPENAKPVMPATSDTWGLSWTSDDRIVYISDQTGDAEIWIMNADGSDARVLTNDRIFKTTPVVSSDGRYIVYTSSAGSGQLVRIDINGGNPLVLSQITGADNADISPDGKWVVFSAWVDGLLKIHRVSIDGGEVKVLTDHRATEPRYSPDGTRIACFMPNEQTQAWTRLAIIPVDGGEALKIFDSPPNTNISRGPVWTPDGKGITLIVSPGELQNLWLQPVDGDEARQMTNFGLPGIARRDYSRDGKRIALVRAEGVGNAIMITDFR